LEIPLLDYQWRKDGDEIKLLSRILFVVGGSVWVAIECEAEPRGQCVPQAEPGNEGTPVRKRTG
jgi:hypothetical protein